jgi:uncharacterized phage protein (TIGR02218 family)
MTFDAQETGLESGEPIELFEFRLGVLEFNYTSNENDVALLSRTWVAIPISRGRIIQAVDEQQGDKLDLELPSNNEFIAKFIQIVPGQRATFTLRRYHRNDAGSEAVTLFKGVLQNVNFTDNGRRAKVQALPLTRAKSRPLPRMTYQNLCNHMLYDSRCKIDKDNASFKKSLTVSAVSGNVLTVTGAGAFGADFFEGGYIEFNDDFRQVVEQGGTGNNDLTLRFPFENSPVGEVVICRAGCKHRLITDCQTKFSNVVNFGGFPYVPTKNPFETGLD